MDDGEGQYSRQELTPSQKAGLVKNLREGCALLPEARETVDRLQDDAMESVGGKNDRELAAATELHTKLQAADGVYTWLEHVESDIEENQVKIAFQSAQSILDAISNNPMTDEPDLTLVLTEELAKLNEDIKCDQVPYKQIEDPDAACLFSKLTSEVGFDR